MSKIVYISSPYTKGDQSQNVRNSLIAAEELRTYGYLPFAPLLSHFWHFAFPHDYEYWMKMDLEWIEKVDYVLRLPGESSGADTEVARSLWLNVPVYCSVFDVINKTNEICYKFDDVVHRCKECDDFVVVDIVEYSAEGHFHVCTSCGKIIDV